MSDSTPATEYRIPQPGPSVEHDRRVDELLSLLTGYREMAMRPPRVPAPMNATGRLRGFEYLIRRAGTY